MSFETVFAVEICCTEHAENKRSLHFQNNLFNEKYFVNSTQNI